MSRAQRVLTVTAAILPALAVLAAVTATPRSAYSVPTLEVKTPRGPVVVTAAKLGVHRTARGVAVDDVALDRVVARLIAAFRQPARADSYALEDGSVILRPGRNGIELDKKKTRALLLHAIHGRSARLVLPLRRVSHPMDDG